MSLARERRAEVKHHLLIEHGMAHLEKGGWIMLIIVALSVWMWTLIIWQWLLLRNARIHDRNVLECLQHLNDASFTAAGWQTYLIQATRAASKLTPRVRRRYMKAQSDSVVSSLDRYTGGILMLAGAAPLLGLLGTVTGMIETFDIIQIHGAGDAKGLASGISIALITTQAGLVTAVPGLVLGYFFRRRAQQARERVDRFTHGLMREVERGRLVLSFGVSKSTDCRGNA